MMRFGRLLLIAGIMGGCATANSDGPDAGTDEAPPPEIKPDAAPRPSRPDAGPNEIAPDAAVPDGICAAALQMPNNDACANAIDLTAQAQAAGGANVFGSTVMYIDDLEPDPTCTSDFGQDGPDAVYKVSATTGQTLTATMLPQDFDGSVYIVASCADLTECVGADDALSGLQEVASAEILADSEFFIVVDSFVPDQSGCFTLSVTLQ